MSHPYAGMLIQPFPWCICWTEFMVDTQVTLSTPIYKWVVTAGAYIWWLCLWKDSLHLHFFPSEILRLFISVLLGCIQQRIRYTPCFWVNVEAQEKDGHNLLCVTYYTEALSSHSYLNVVWNMLKRMWNDFCAEVGAVLCINGICNNQWQMAIC